MQVREAREEMFSNRDLRKLIIPLVVEQVMSAMMGMADTMMVSNIGEAALSGVSLVDTINVLILFFFSAMATGGTVVCGQYLGRGDGDKANHVARQLYLITAVLAVILTAVCVPGRRLLLRLIYGAVDRAVMEASLTYFLITALSYPFVGLFNASAALYRSVGNSRLPMTVSLVSNLINIAGNALLIFVLRWGIAGAALSTLVCRIFAAVVMVAKQHKPGQEITVDRYLSIRPDREIIKRILSIGVPAGLENCVFQIGKLAVQSTVSTLGTTAIAAQAVTYTMEYVTSMPSQAIGTGMLTVVSRCMGAGRIDEAKRYTKKLVIAGELALLAAMGAVYLAREPIIALSHLGPEAADLTRHLVRIIFLVKSVPWTCAFVLPNCMRAAGDVKYPMIVAGLTMWFCRVLLCVVLCRFLGVGLIGVWIGMMADWFIRAILYVLRYVRGTWTHKRVIV